MKILYFMFILFLGTYLVNAQVGIDTDTPDKSSVLDINSSKKGLRMPAVSLKGRDDLTTIPNPANGLMIYNIANAQLGTENEVLKNNYYYFEKPKNKWQVILTEETLSVKLDSVSIPSLAAYIFRSYRQQFKNWGTTPYHPIEFNLNDGVHCENGDFSIVSDPTECEVRSDHGESMEINLDNGEFLVKKTGIFQINAFINVLFSRGQIPGPRINTIYNLVFQKKASASEPWVDPDQTNIIISSPCIYYEQKNLYENLTQNCTVQDLGILKKGEVLRMLVIYKSGPIITNPTQAQTQFSFYLGVPFAVGFNAIYYKPNTGK